MINDREKRKRERYVLGRKRKGRKKDQRKGKEEKGGKGRNVRRRRREEEEEVKKRRRGGDMCKEGEGRRERGKATHDRWVWICAYVSV